MLRGACVKVSWCHGETAVKGGRAAAAAAEATATDASPIINLNEVTSQSPVAGHHPHRPAHQNKVKTHKPKQQQNTVRSNATHCYTTTATKNNQRYQRHQGQLNDDDNDDAAVPTQQSRPSSREAERPGGGYRPEPWLRNEGCKSSSSFAGGADAAAVTSC